MPLSLFVCVCICVCMCVCVCVCVCMYVLRISRGIDDNLMCRDGRRVAVITPNQSDAKQLVVRCTQSSRRMTIDPTDTVSGYLVLACCWIKSVKVERVALLLSLSLSLCFRLQLLRRQRRDTAAAQPAAPHIKMGFPITAL